MDYTKLSFWGFLSQLLNLKLINIFQNLTHPILQMELLDLPSYNAACNYFNNAS